ncbi:PTS system beta-glucosides-specific iiABC component [Paenibacillus terrae HPL-003]|uniref:PTS system beta-glucosides-specific iiABC component n=1 Tax=Paenibacillus terrae (strain HPL-003) TaxID=985665 RepID=G7VVJ7_PAETH|nr:PTS transporter subunit EIIC [Paenibacillus terrae]AET57031.1 PTS system beta-glucosides-specific iiABC component [Paenibacillus terrae HPL-003]
MSKKNYDELADQVLANIGGKDNISYSTHCVTRLRFNLKDQSLANEEEIEKISGVIGAQWQGDQFQIVIGQTVGDAYKAISEKAGFTQDNAQDDSQEEKGTTRSKKKFSLNAILDGLAGSIAPVIPILIGGGLIKVLVLLLTNMGLLSAESATLTILNLVGNAAFYFLPVFVGASAARKFNTSAPLGMLFGAILIDPTFVSKVANNEALSFIGIPVTLASYGNTVFPIIMIVFIMSYVERFFSRISPTSLKALFVPVAVILVMTPIALCIVGPLGVIVGDYITTGIIFLYDKVGFLGVAIMASLFPLLVLTGMHTTLAPYLVQMMASVKYEPLVIIGSIITNFSIGAACIAIALRAKGKTLKSTSASCAVTSMAGGVSEPALFGVVLKLRKPLYAVLIGNFIGGIYAGLTKVYAYAFVGSGGIFGIPALAGPDASNIINGIIAIALSIISTFLITLIWGFEEKK